MKRRVSGDRQARPELYRRYDDFCFYMQETRHNWAPLFCLHDEMGENIIEITEQSTLTGRTRERRLFLEQQPSNPCVCNIAKINRLLPPWSPDWPPT